MTGNAIIPHPYRANAPQLFCVTCHAPAVVHCPRCRRPFCADHATITCCPDCELALARSSRRWTAGLLTGYLAAAGSAVCCMATVDSFLAVATGAFGVLGSIFVTAIARRAARGRIRSWEPVEGAELRIGAEGGEARHARRLGWLMRSTGKKDMYQAAYDAGFNRVQGCA